MENQHRLIQGYRELSEEEVALINEIKTKGYELGALIDKLKNHVNEQARHEDSIIMDRHKITEPHRWLAMARTSGQNFIMQAVRAVAQPDDGF